VLNIAGSKNGVMTTRRIGDPAGTISASPAADERLRQGGRAETGAHRGADADARQDAMAAVDPPSDRVARAVAAMLGPQLSNKRTHIPPFMPGGAAFAIVARACPCRAGR